MTAGERAWLELMVAQWGEQVAQMERIACTRRSILNRAGGLASVVADLRARLDASPLPIAPPRQSAEAATLMTSLRRHELAAIADWHARRAAGEQVAPRARRNLFAEMKAAAQGLEYRACGRGEIAPAAWLPVAPPPIAAPFVAGPQMSFDL